MAQADPLNAHIFIGKGSGPDFEEPPRQIVGIVGDVHDGPLNRAPQPTMYVPAAQLTDGLNARIVRGSMAWVIRTKVAPRSLEPMVRQELRKASGLPVANARTMEETLSRTTRRADFNMVLLAIFGGSALLLAAIGVYGLIAHAVQQRTQEIAIRMALGADARRLRQMLLWQTARLAVVGTIIGIVAALGLGQFIASFLFGVKPSDPMALVAAPLSLLVVALPAAWVPALRVSRVAPANALRS